MQRQANIIRLVYRRALPESIRSLPWIHRLKALLNHDFLYSSDYYANTVDPPAQKSAVVMAKSIMDEFNPASIIDVGCGTGALLAALEARGCRVLGLEYSTAALAFCRSRNLNVLRFDIEKETLPAEWRFDVAISLEVAEHLPSTRADRYIDLLIAFAKKIVFTAAPPGQGGADHINEQPQSYWTAKFQERGFRFANELSRRWADEWRRSGQVQSWYHQNLMIFTKNGN